VASERLTRDSGVNAGRAYILVVWMNMNGIVKTKARKKPTIVCVVIY
jgi:hypothetical protein